MAMISNQKSGDDSTNLQAGRDIVVNTGNSVALYSIEEVAKQLLNSAFGELPDDTKNQIKSNQTSYFQALSENLGKIIKQNDELKEIVSSPDLQYISKKAAISASRSSSKDLHNNLSLLIVQRINSDNEDLKRIVYNEAISTIDKLTSNQLKIITLCFLIGRTKLSGLTNLQQFIEFLENKTKPFVDFKRTRAEFEHIAYSGCASISIASRNIDSLFKGNYPEIFKKTDNIKELLRNSKVASCLIDDWESTQIKSMNLTSVGIVIGSTYYEQKNGDKLNIDIWIN